MVDICRTFVSTELPILEQFSDYHYVDDYASSLSKLFGQKIRGAEVGYCENGRIWGVFYVGRKPKKADIKVLLDEAKYVPMVE